MAIQFPEQTVFDRYSGIMQFQLPGIARMLTNKLLMKSATAL
jgi:hypothetical protein